MALTTSTITTSPATQEFFSGGSRFTLTAASTNGSSVLISQDAQGAQVLATLAAGGTATFSSPGGFFYESTSVCSVTVVQGFAPAIEQVASGAALTNTTTETVVAQLAIPANTLQSGTTIRVRGLGRCTAYNSGTLTQALYIGAAGTTADTKVATLTTTTPVATNSGITEGVYTVRAAPGATVAVVGGGWQSDYSSSAAMSSHYIVPTNFATNAVLYVTLTLKWSAANAGNSAQSEQFEVTIQ